MARLSLVCGDLTRVEVDAIVNAANERLLGGGGVDGAIHRAGGPSIMKACDEIRAQCGGCPTGEAVLTTAGDLPARWVIHTVGPIWRGGDQGEPDLLGACYRNSLLVARQQGLRTVAFPSISTGVYGYPVAEAAAVAVRSIAEVLAQWPTAFDAVQMVLFSQTDLRVYDDALRCHLGLDDESTVEA